MNSRPKLEEYDFHPAAAIFPLMPDEQLKQLAADIEANGQHEDVILFKNKVLDGRNRYRACHMLGREPGYAMLEECKDPVEYVIGANLHRRQLKPSQRAMCAAKMAGLKNGRPSKETVQNCTVSLPSDDAADLFQVSRRSVCAALEVLRLCGSDVIRLCELGLLAVSAAAKVASLEPDKKAQNKLAKDGAKAVRDYLAEQRQQQPAAQTVDLPDKANVSEVAEVERWLEQQDDRPFFERFKTLWDAADGIGKAAIRAFVMQE